METPPSDKERKNNGSRCLPVAQETCSATTPPETTCRDGVPTSLSLQLEIPHIRPEAFPWGSDNVEIHASFSLESSRSLIVLPSVIDLGTLLVLRKEGRGVAARKAENVEVEIFGNDDGVTFALGNASLPLPTGQLVERSSTVEHHFRASLVSAAGMRTGTLVGAFRSHGSPIKEPADRGSTVATIGPATTESATAGAALGSASDRGIENEAPGDPSGEFNDEWLEDQAIELLDTANKILASSNLSAARPHVHVCGISSSAYGDEKGQDADYTSQTQTSGGVDHSPRKNSIGEDRRQRQPRLPTAGFKFEPTTGIVEWHRVASVNVSKIEREGDLQTLKQFLPEIAVGKLDEDDIDANPGLVNAFRLAQLQAQYLLHCQQVLQRQRDGLKSAVSTMETEVEGNSQGATAIKNRVRLLRKETHKQDKIINGYAALLRTHNPSLASKVVLDENGRLEVFREDGEIARHKGDGKRRARDRSRRDRRNAADQNPKSGVFKDNEHGGPDACRPSRALSSSNNSSHWSEAGGRPSRARSLASLSVAPGTTDEGRQERANLSRIDARAKQTAEDLRPGGECGADHGGRLHSDGREVEGQHSQRLREQEGTGSTEAGHDARTSAGAASVLAATDNATEIGPLSAADGESTRGSSGCGLDRVCALSTMTRPAKSPQDGSKKAIFVVGARASDATTPPPCGDGWERTSSELSRSKRLAVVGSGSKSEDADRRRCVEEGNPKATGRTPRVVTVTVKPKQSPPAATSSSPEKGDTTFPLDELQRHHQYQKDLARRASINDNNDRNNDSSNNNITWPPNGAGGSEASHGAPRSNTLRAEGRASGKPSPAFTLDEFSKRTPLAGGADTAGAASSTRRVPSGSSREINSHAADPIASAPVADASRLGLEGDNFPDLSDFDVDDISEIDAGGEWSGREGAGSLSS